ncbi:prepilin-type N-terminal cleavage/methylation domain-containing protein [Cloacibacillus porcorum]|uniref:prepilin-type N-terminal cleavage/methylation domain-containing protein n=1 Tax=Cloacibacillus porcorum TaxID=1197717 RepID=UPI0014596E4C|nr:prepilin-type N-terminal cleavage/methylation domain-containing protein [Cloacibacillus porcorum]MDY5391007.1 prepilin-type N-terminal cleavage/methylation domain-containing protein [Cloacibacillus porcorum]NMF18135.1 prepilin-type N-terminal cleavage/methylation domain-containing protein [Cloacibacillus porcorum]
MKKMIKKYRKAKGFTLIELLIVIVIIGILAGMMMLSTGAATDRAQATKLLSDLRNIKAATLMVYVDNGVEWPTQQMSVGGTTDSSIDKYLDSKPTGATFNVTYSGSADIKATITATNVPAKVGEKLKVLEDSAGISVDAGNTKVEMFIK